MNIGDLAAASGVSAKMIRYYEKVGLTQPPPRTQAGYRSYGERDVHILRFVRRARDLGFTVEEIRELLSLWQDHNRQSADVKRMALDHVRNLETKARELQQMANTLKTLAECCSGDDRPDCPILADLETGEPLGIGVAAPRFGTPGSRNARGKRRA